MITNIEFNKLIQSYMIKNCNYNNDEYRLSYILNHFYCIMFDMLEKCKQKGYIRCFNNFDWNLSSHLAGVIFKVELKNKIIVKKEISYNGSKGIIINIPGHIRLEFDIKEG